MPVWTPEQDNALTAVARWLETPRGPQVFRLFGYAGTGKSTLARHIAEHVDGDVAFAAFTGKAALVMRSKGCKDARTIHSLIYRATDSETAEPSFVLNDESDASRARLIVIDECSMVDEELGRDLLSFGKKVLVLGDPAQLPPVKGGGFFTEAEPDVMLTEVHRQAADNPIIRLSMIIRDGGTLQRGDYGEARVVSREGLDPGLVTGADQVLVGLNKTRHAYNRRIRELKGIASETPIVGDKLVCLRNAKEKRLLNGSLWSVVDTPVPKKPDHRDGTTPLVVAPDDASERTRDVDVRVKNEFWTGRDGDLDWRDKRGTEEFTFGYALTCHKAQGSQWEDVLVFDESAAFREDRSRWLYTAITRAARKLTIVTSTAA